MPKRPANAALRGLKKLLHLAARPAKSKRAHGGRVIHTYRGYGTHREVLMMGRVFRQPGFNLDLPEGSIRRDLADIARRTVRWGVKHVEVEVILNGTREVVTTDRDGYFDVHLHLESPLPEDRIWHQAKLRVLSPSRDPHSRRANGGAEAEAVADIYIPPSDIDFAVISDIDDTVMYTGVANKLMMMYRLFLADAKQRTAFPGVAPLYRGFHLGDGDRHCQRPLLYVSRAPWSIYEMLEEFFRLNNIPVGPILFLREWGLTLQRPLPRRAEDHKHDVIETMLALYDPLPFVLIGDSGQHDPEIYTAIVREHPDRIRTVYIRDVSDDPDRRAAIERLAAEIDRDTGCSLVLASDSLTMAEHAHREGYISEEALEQVRAAR
ncbi:App1 family protein [Kushneria aurantia]|uniref:App1 family protein n=1 Tax=Kushneria aurantia TaxID=504092 RepID=A0ABV6G229_9GAMM|nr:phosphatase domain-containing protein [Kushneria aurantia]